MKINWKKNVVSKKSHRYFMNIPRIIFSILNSRNNSFSAILCNSFPKSGTHLLIQILEVLPGIKDWGYFLASTPSFRFREIPPSRMAKKINKIVGDELVGAHLHYSDAILNAIEKNNLIHFFIYRDPRDVVISEAHYLTDMNSWHYLSKYFKSLPDLPRRIDFSILGTEMIQLKVEYPNIAQRFYKYKPWISCTNVCAIRFEDLISEKREKVISKIYRFYIERTSTSNYIEEYDFLSKVTFNINPANSHTFRSGKSGNWKTTFTERQKDLFKEIAGDLLIELGYEKDYNW